ncbi:ribosomal large subunit pseudouridine synthase C [Sulfuritortus calidifontis]|uniref:Pseudouridine synthase n=1 Tax=Sulfuritortus calidifontis TaxID=1914471 RepID=A0A4R3JUG8_9PROT|nr:RluA family pseudouridine synthase [Sulfuritortus calidifontis]TCS71469.1 ribosomal large subunit pseudouridine synthase C [Sulfuritortus calidifontis]
MQPSSAPAPARVVRVVIGPEEAGQRLDNYLFKKLKGVPKTRIYRICRDGEVRVNGRRIEPAYRLVEGDELRIPPVRLAERPDKTPVRVVKPLLDRVIYRDDSLLIIDKPAGMAVHGGSGVSQGVIEQLRVELPEARFLELAHRLDRETSGVLVLALKRAALVELHRMLREGEMRKRYLALATGHWRDPVRNVRLALKKYVTGEGERRVAAQQDGQAAHTIFRLVGHYPGFSLLEAELKTGRTHQIRVHLAALKHPIAGDDKYGDFELNKRLKSQGLKRMFLHAAALEFKHPLTGKPLKLEAPLPDDLQGFLNSLKTESRIG